jgi:glucose-6-phosphate-specific signal transduction histidine kinase
MSQDTPILVGSFMVLFIAIYAWAYFSKKKRQTLLINVLIAAVVYSIIIYKMYTTNSAPNALELVFVLFTLIAVHLLVCFTAFFYHFLRRRKTT